MQRMTARTAARFLLALFLVLNPLDARASAFSECLRTLDVYSREIPGPVLEILYPYFGTIPDLDERCP